MKKLFLLTNVLTILFFAGCNVQGPGYYEKMTETINAGIDAQQKSTDKIINAVEASTLVSAEKLEGVQKVVVKSNTTLDTLQEAALAAAKTYDEEADEDPIVAAIAALQVANTTTAPINPYSPLIDAALGIALIVTGYGYRNKSKKYSAMKKGVNEFMATGSGDTGTELYDTIGEARKDAGIK